MTLKLYLTTVKINAADLAVLLPMLKFPEDTVAGKLLRAIGNMSQNQLRGFLNAFPQEAIPDILSTAVTDNESKLLPALEKLAKSYGFPMEITGLSISKEGRICLQIGSVDYPAIVSNYHPLILRGGINIVAENPLLRNLFNMMSLSLKAGLTVLSRIPAKALDAMVVALINRNADKILEKLNGMLAKKDFSLQLENLKAEE